MKQNSNTDPIKTLLVICTGFSIIYAVTGWRGALTISISIGFLGLISKSIAGLINTIWMKLASILSYIIPNILLSLLFYLILFPISLLYRLTGNKDALHLKNNSDTLWDETESDKELHFDKTW